MGQLYNADCSIIVTDLKVEAVVSWLELLQHVDLVSVGRRLEGLQRELRKELADQGVADVGQVDIRSSLDLRYLGQSFELPIPWDSDLHHDMLAGRFHDAHRHLYGFAAPEELVELVALRVSALGRVSQPPREALASAADSVKPISVRRLVADDPAETVGAQVYNRKDLLVGHELKGPSLVLDVDATTYLPPRWIARVEQSGHLIAQQ